MSSNVSSTVQNTAAHASEASRLAEGSRSVASQFVYSVSSHMTASWPSIVRRAASLFDEVVVAIGVNKAKASARLFTQAPW